MAQAKKNYGKAISIALLAGTLGLLPGIARADNWALLIGIDQYEDANRINPLGAAGADAKALAKTLKETAGFSDDHIQLLVSDGGIKPTRTNILNGLARLAKNAQPGDTVFVLYSGHGVEVAGTPYLLPFDTSALDDDTLVDSALAVSKFRQRLAQIKAKALVLAFDMCRSDPRKSGRDVAASDNKLSKDLARSLDFKKSASDGDNVSAATPVAITFYSCSPDQRSYEWAEKGRGYFSYYLEQGLRGKAADSTGKVTALSLSQYVGKEVKAAVQRSENKAQVPYPSLDGPGADSFILATDAVPIVAGKTTKPVKTDTKAQLKVTVDKPGATVTVDGKPVTGGLYTTNLMDTEEREVTVKVTASGYEGQVFTATLGRGKTVTLPVTLIASAAPDAGKIITGANKVLIAYHPPKGYVSRVKTSTVLRFSANGNTATLVHNAIGRTTCTKVAASGEITLESKLESHTMTLNGQVVPDNGSAEGISRWTLKPNGMLTTYSDSNPSQSGGEDDHVPVRLQVANTPVFPDKPLEVGDTWSQEFKENTQLGTWEAIGNYEILGFETVKGVPCVKVKINYRELYDDGFTLKGTLLMETTTGDPIVEDCEITGLYMQGAVAEGTFHGERVDVAPAKGNK